MVEALDANALGQIDGRPQIVGRDEDLFKIGARHPGPVGIGGQNGVEAVLNERGLTPVQHLPADAPGQWPAEDIEAGAEVQVENFGVAAHLAANIGLLAVQFGEAGLAAGTVI